MFYCRQMSFIEWLLRKHWDNVKGDKKLITSLYLILYNYEKHRICSHAFRPSYGYQNIRYIAQHIKKLSDKEDDKLIVDHWLIT